MVETLGHTPEEDESFVFEDALEVKVIEVEDGSVTRVEVKALVRERELLENATLAEQTDGEVSE